MPQLDFLIIFPQIFWMCLIFSLFYFSLTFYFLPKFFLSLKLRKFILEENSRKILTKSNLNLSKKSNVHVELEAKVESLLRNFENLEVLLRSDALFTSSNFDSKIMRATRSTMLFCDTLILKNILLFPKVFK